ncbi:MAG: ATP-binding cassette domain-containing protein [Candidatus Stahlbacteria bacterium]|nr:ATP-binding cassette domain-containing protein [Candidatus Stahlbacteria bacterium]
MIEVANLTKRYGMFKAVDNISFSIEKGEVVGFLGPNGAGKTTTLRILTGYFPSSQGDCKIAGYDIEGQGIEAKSKIGYLPESNPLYNEMKVIEYLQFVGTIRDVEGLNNRIKEVAERCRIKDVIGKAIGELSKGYRQRVGLAQSILHEPDILIMDEPTEGLDPNQVVEVRGLIKELGKEKTVLISTHRLSEVEATCERILIINKGKIVADAKKEELFKLSKGMEMVDVEIKAPKEDVLRIMREQPGIIGIKIKEDGEITSYEIEAKADPRETIFNLCVANKWTMIDMHRRVVSLENVFRELTTDDK